ncbi:alpha/beta fold hydrolase [Variovorax rhizosphaerae]|uniref:Alpha/beta fold hydrolase n=1 Tax=Variovorax rhizosphaerae TaxID=1836200 RepID=A0ABU8WVF6_9BURK
MDNVAKLKRLAQRHTVDTRRGERIVWRRFGDGPPLMLLHGGHGSWLHWARNIQALSRAHAVWVPDMPGYGDSATPAEPTLASIVCALEDTLGQLVGSDTSVHLVGFSFGGLVAANLARNRAKVSSLPLLGPAGHGGNRRPRAELKSWRAAHEQHDHAALGAAMRHNLWTHMLHDAASVDDTALHIHTQACLRARFRSKPISRAGDLPGLLAGYSGPLLLAWGEHDVTAEPSRAVQVLAHGRRDCRTCIVPGAGHWVQYEAAAETNALLLHWLESAEQRHQEN